jgi:hypothetical protein
MEIYLNVAEWGPGVYGAEAAAWHYFHKPADALDPGEAVRLAAALPDPLGWSPRGLCASASNGANCAASPSSPRIELSSGVLTLARIRGATPAAK